MGGVNLHRWRRNHGHVAVRWHQQLLRPGGTGGMYLRLYHRGEEFFATESIYRRNRLTRLGLPLARLDAVLLHRQRPVDVVQFVVQPACITHGFPSVVPTPQRRSGR